MYLELDALKAYKSKSWDKGICMQLAIFDRILEYITRAVWLLSHGKSSLLILTCSFQIYFLLQEAPCGDLTTHLFCHLCAICQEYREIRERTDSGSSAPTVTPPAIQTMDEPWMEIWNIDERLSIWILTNLWLLLLASVCYIFFDCASTGTTTRLVP